MNLRFELKRLLFVTIGTVVFVIGISFFIVPAALVPGGITGFATLTQYGFNQLGVSLNLGLLVLVFNIPIIVIGIKGISKTFVYYSIYSIVLQSILLGIFDQREMIFGSDILASSIFGGIAIGLGASIALKSGSSLGGMDILSQYIALKFKMSVGHVSLFANAIILGIALVIFDPQIALYTLLALAVANLLIDRIHTAYKRVRLDIVTPHGEAVKEALISAFIRGITIIDGVGAYTGERRNLLWMVTQTHEVYDIQKIVLSIDPNAFMTMTPIRHLSGKFHKVIMK